MEQVMGQALDARAPEEIDILDIGGDISGGDGRYVFTATRGRQFHRIRIRLLFSTDQTHFSFCVGFW